MTKEEIKKLAEKLAEEFWENDATVSEEIFVVKSLTTSKEEFRTLWNAIFKELQRIYD